MSANNQIKIYWKKPSYFVIEKDIEVKDKWGVRLGNAKTLEKAVKIANKYMQDCAREGYPVEYGLSIKLKKL